MWNMLISWPTSKCLKWVQLRSSDVTRIWWEEARNMRRRSMETPIQSYPVNNRKPRWNTLFQMFQWFKWILQEPWAIILPYRRIGQPGACSVKRMGAECGMCLPFHHSTVYTRNYMAPENDFFSATYLNSNSGYYEQHSGSQRTRFRKEKWTFGMYGHLLLPEILRSFLNVGPFCGMWTTKTKNPQKFHRVASSRNFGSELFTSQGRGISQNMCM